MVGDAAGSDVGVGFGVDVWVAFPGLAGAELWKRQNSQDSGDGGPVPESKEGSDFSHASLGAPQKKLTWGPVDTARTARRRFGTWPAIPDGAWRTGRRITAVCEVVGDKGSFLQPEAA